MISGLCIHNVRPSPDASSFVCAETARQYLENTKSYGNIRMYDVWAVNREGEAQRFSAHDKIGNRKLLWHGTNGERKRVQLRFSFVPVVTLVPDAFDRVITNAP